MCQMERLQSNFICKLGSPIASSDERLTDLLA